MNGATFSQFDVHTSQLIQNATPPSWVAPLFVLSILGSAEVLTLFLVVGLFITRKKNHLLAFFTFLLYCIGSGMEVLGKIFIKHPGPPFIFRNFGMPSMYIKLGNSYPSGHSFRIVFLMVVVLFAIWNEKKLSSLTKALYTSGLALFVVTMLVSRVSLGEHWISDVIGGSLLGLMFGFLYAAVAVRHLSSNRRLNRLMPKK